MVALVLSILFNSPVWASSAPQFSSLRWKADDSIDLTILAGSSPILLEGTVKEGGSLAFSKEAVDVTLTAHSNSFISLTLTVSGEERGTLVILERQNGRYVPLAPTISGPLTTLRADYEQALAELEKRNNWDHSLAIRALLSYFSVNKEHTMSQFRAAVEADQVSLVAKPHDSMEKRFKLKPIGPESDPASIAAPATPAAPKRKATKPAAKPYEPRFEGYRPSRPQQDRSQWRPWYNWFSPRQP